MVINGKEEKAYDKIWGSIFSSDSQKLAYVAKGGEKEFVVVNDREGKVYDKILGSVKGGKDFVEGKVFGPIFSPDSQKLAYIDKEGRKRIMVVNGKEGKAYDRVVGPVFSPDSQRLIYVAMEGRKLFKVVNSW